MEGKLYDEKEMSMVLKRAAELDAKRGTSGGTGLVSADDLRRIAREAGISEESLEAALSSSASGRGGALRALFGGPFEESFEVSVPGEASDETLEDALDEICGSSKLPGTGSVRKGRLRWSVDGAASMQTGRYLEVQATVRAGQTRIAVKNRYGNMAGGIFGGLGGGLGLGLGVGVGIPVGIESAGSWLIGIAIFLGAFGFSWLLSRTIFSLITKRYAHQSCELLDKVADAIRKGIASGTGGGDSKGSRLGPSGALDELAARAKAKGAE